jgi:predicted permease
VLLALTGGTAGCLLAVWLMGLVRSYRPPSLLPVRIEINLTLDARILAFTFATSVLAGVLFGLAPAWHSSKLAIVPLLKEGVAIGGRARHFSLRNVLVTVQVAVSLLLLICAGLFLRSLGQAQNLDPKFETERILTVPLDLRPGGEYTEERVRMFYGQLLDQIERVPGVQSASLAEIIPLQLHRKEYSVAVEGFEAPNGNYPEIDENTVGPRYFETMGIQLLAGREFTRLDTASAPPVVIVNETMARRFWPFQSPLGKRLRFPLRNNTFTPYHEVVGLAEDSKYSRLGEEAKPFFYRPTLQEYGSPMVLHVRTAGAARAF